MKSVHKIILIIFLTIFFSIKIVYADYLYILNDSCIKNLYNNANLFFKNSDIKVLKDSRGIILRYYILDVINEYNNLNIDIYKKIELFLAKIENPVIIEVHVEKLSKKEFKNFKKWEVSIMLANKIESLITLPKGKLNNNRVNSIGYGEFLPSKNTSNNGGKFNNRIDIIVLCNIIGE